MPEEPNRFARELFNGLPARYDRLAELLSFGQNGQWRAEMVGHVVPADGVILDVASGTAGVALQLAARSGARVVGVDLTEPMLRQGQRRVAAAGLRDRISLAAGRAEQLPFPDASVDALTFTYLLRYVRDPQATLAELARVLKPGGSMASLEFCVPAGPLWHPAWWAYTRMVLPGRRPAARRPGVVPGGPLPRPQHLRALPQVPGRLDGGGVGKSRPDRRRDPGHEPRRRPRHVGHPPGPGGPGGRGAVAGGRGYGGRAASRERGARGARDTVPRTTRPGRARGATGGRCCIRRTRPGTCPTW